MVTGFYIVDSGSFNILFHKPSSTVPSQRDLEASLVDWVLNIYRSSSSFNDLGSIQYIEFMNRKIVIRERFAFIFILTAPHYYSFDIISSQIFFYQNLFLTAFDITDDKSAQAFLDELTVIRKRDISEPLIQAYMLWSVLDIHVNEVDIRNMLEVFVNLFNALLSGFRQICDESSLASFLTSLTNSTLITASYVSSILSFAPTGVDIRDVKPPTCHIDEIKRELLSVLSFFLDWLDNHYGVDKRRELVASNLLPILKMEWQRMSSLDILKPLVFLLWS